MARASRAVSLHCPCITSPQTLFMRSEALQTGLEASGSKRKQPEGGSGGAGGSRPAAKKGMLDSMLGDISSSEDEDEEDEEEQ